MFVGGGLSRATVFALGIMPYISASIFVQIAGAVLPTVDKMQKDEEGRKKLTQYTRYLTVVLALVQAYGFALFTASLPARRVASGTVVHGADDAVPHHGRDLRDVAG